MTSTLSALFSSRKMFIMFWLGFSSGLPLMIMSSNLMLWYAQAHIEVKDIALLSLIGLPYSLKFVWSPLVDHFGNRRQWLYGSQISLALLLLFASLYTPDQSPYFIAIIGVFICLSSATQDIAYSAFQVDTLQADEKSLGASVGVLGYRLAMFVSGALGLILANYWGWQWSFRCLAGLFSIGFVATFFAQENDKSRYLKSFQDAVILPFKEFFTRTSFRSGLIILLIIILYKLSDAMAFSLNSVFFKVGLGFDLNTIAFAYKTNSLISTFIGIMIGGILIRQLGILRAFILFSFIMAFANLTYFILALTGKNIYLMSLSVFIEYFCAALGSMAFVTALLSLCNKQISATQYALFSSLDSIARVFIGPAAGQIQHHFNWSGLFLLSFIIGICISILIYVSRHILRDALIP